MHPVLSEPVSQPGSRRGLGRGFVLFSIRFATATAFAIWFGGFTFYAAVVVPDLHEALGGPQTGEISRRVSVILNVIGAAAVGLGWLRLITDRTARSGWRGKGRAGLLAATSLLLLALVERHQILSAMVDSGAANSDFMPRHEFYLILCTIQWGINLGLLAIEVSANLFAKREKFFTWN